MSLEHLDAVDGWLDPLAARVTDYLLRYQSARGLLGDVCEVGVYHGRYFLVLLGALTADERGVAIDLFGMVPPAIGGSAEGDLAAFEANLRHWAPERRVVTLRADSRNVTAESLGEERPFRFVSIDGSHDHDTVVSDLTLAAETVMSGGLVALDDWADAREMWIPGGRNQWPEVATGEEQFQRDHPNQLLHIGAIPNKLLLTTDATWVEDYRKILRGYQDVD